MSEEKQKIQISHSTTDETELLHQAKNFGLDLVYITENLGKCENFIGWSNSKKCLIFAFKCWNQGLLQFEYVKKSEIRVSDL